MGLVKFGVRIDLAPRQGRLVLEDRIVDALERRLRQAASDVRDQMKTNISINSPPPQQGDFPGKVSGGLVASLYSGMRGRLESYVASTSPVAVWQHLGRPGGGRIYPKTRFNALSWVDWRSGQRVFYKSVREGYRKPRPFMSATLEQMWAQGLGRWLTRPI